MALTLKGQNGTALNRASTNVPKERSFFRVLMKSISWPRSGFIVKGISGLLLWDSGRDNLSRADG